MFTKNQILMGIIVATIGKAISIAPVNAWPDPSPVQSNNFVPDDPTISSSGLFGIGGGGESSTGGISIPPGMNRPSKAASGTNSGGSSSGIAGDTNPSDTSTASAGSNTNGTITVADIAKYFAASIDRSLDGANTSDVAQKPLRIVRRRNSASCPNPSIARPSESLDDLLSQSEEFLEQVNKLKPENSVW
ncbi:MAG: hypothetical protein AB4206_09245 [Xenococcaceae cyanobacterium]